MSRPILLLVLCCITLWAGCRSPLDDQLYADWVDQNAAAWPGADRALAVVTSQKQSDVLGADARLADYIRLALKDNPSLVAARQRVLALGQKVPQVTSLDDPMFRVAPVGEMAQTAAGEVELMASVSQKLPFPGKLATRGRIAQQAVAVALHELEQTRLDVVADTRQAYWSYVFAVRAIEVTHRNRDLLMQFLDIAKSKYKSGAATQQDVLRASVEVSDLDSQALTFEQHRQTASAMLNRLMNRPIHAPLPVPVTATLETITLEREALLNQAAQVNPQLRKIHEKIEANRQRIKLARLQRWPDLTLSANYNAVDDSGLAPSSNGRDQWWLGFCVNLPIWMDKLAAGEKEAFHGMTQSLAELTAMQNRVAFRVQDAMVRVETQQRIVLLLGEVTLPQARQAVEVSASSYRAGQIDFLSLVTNWRKLLDFELMYHQALTQLEQNFADLQRAVGRDLRRGTPSLPQEENDHEN